MEETIIHTFPLDYLNVLPEVFASLEELYIMLLDLVYTKRYQCLSQYQSIISYCIENNYLVHVQYYIAKFAYHINYTQLIIGCLCVIPTMIAACYYADAAEFAQALLNDISTQIQDYHLEQLLREKYAMSLKFNKIFSYKQVSYKQYVDIINILLSVAYEGLGQYQNALNSIYRIGEHDDSVQLACFRIKFNLIYQQSEQFGVPMYEMARDSIESMMYEVYKFCNDLTYRKTKQKGIFNYDLNLMNYVSTLYLARLNTMLCKFEEANYYYLDIYTISPDDESLEESIVAHLDNLVRYSCGERNDLSLVTKSPLWYFFNNGRVRKENVSYAIRIAQQYTYLADKQQLGAIAHYYIGHLHVILRNYDEAIDNLKRAKELNYYLYKYPSELVSVAWLPGMIDFDLLSVILLTGRREICLVNYPNYFDTLIRSKNIVTILSPERYEMAEIVHVLFNFQRKYLQNDLLATEDVLGLLVRVGMIDYAFAPEVYDFCYVYPSTNNCYLIAQAYYLGAHFLREYYVQAANQCDERLYDLIKEFPQLRVINYAITSKNAMSAESASEAPTAQGASYLMIRASRRKQYLDNINKLLQSRQCTETIQRRVQVYYKCLSQSPDTAQGIANLLQDDDIMKALIYAYKGLDVLQTIQNYTYPEFTILRAFCLHEAGKTLEALKLLGYISENTQNKEQLALFYFASTKLLFVNGDTERALNVLLYIEPSVSSYSLLYYSVLLDKILIYEYRDEMHEIFRVGGYEMLFRLLRCMVILKHFQFGMPPSAFLEQINKLSGIEVNDFDKLVITAVNQAQEHINQQQLLQLRQTYASAAAELVLKLSDIMKAFEAPSGTQVYFNYFCLFYIEYARISQALLPQISTKSLFYSDMFDKRLTSAFLVCCLVTFKLAIGAEADVDQQIVYYIFYFMQVQLDVSWINNFTVFLLKRGSAQYVHNVLVYLQQKATNPVVLNNVELLLAAIDGQLPDGIIALSSNPVLQNFEIFTANGPFYIALVAPTYPYNLPSVYNRQYFFNPANYLILETFIQNADSTSGVARCQANAEQISPIYGILRLDYTYETAQSQNMAVSSFQSTADRPPRAKSARPLLKTLKYVADKKTQPKQSLNARFRRLQPLKSKDDEVTINESTTRTQEHVIRRRLQMPGYDSAEREARKMHDMAEEQVEGEIHASGLYQEHEPRSDERSNVTGYYYPEQMQYQDTYQEENAYPADVGVIENGNANKPVLGYAKVEYPTANNNYPVSNQKDYYVTAPVPATVHRRRFKPTQAQ